MTYCERSSCLALALILITGCASSRGRMRDDELVRIAREAALKHERAKWAVNSSAADILDVVLVRLARRPAGDEVAATGGVDVYINPENGVVLDIKGQP